MNNNTNLVSSQQFNEISEYLTSNNLLPQSVEKEHIPLIIALGNKLGLDHVSSIHAIEMVKGNPSIKSKVIPALLAKHGVYIDVIKDYEPIIEKKPVPIKNKETGEIETDDQGRIKFYKNEDGSTVTKDKILDYVTEIEFIKHVPNIGVIKRTCKFKWSWAELAGWTTKSNWQKMPAYMMMARCLVRGTRLYASEAINSMYDELENYDVYVDGDDFQITEDGDIISDND